MLQKTHKQSKLSSAKLAAYHLEEYFRTHGNLNIVVVKGKEL